MNKNKEIVPVRVLMTVRRHYQELIKRNTHVGLCLVALDCLNINELEWFNNHLQRTLKLDLKPHEHYWDIQDSQSRLDWLEIQIEEYSLVNNLIT